MHGPDDGDAALLDVKLLRLFDLLYTTRSVTVAAERLGQAQPTVSVWLSRLRKALDDPLFVRTPEGMQPTPRADALIDPVRVALESLRQVSSSRPAFSPATTQTRFRICMTDASHVTLLPQLLAHLRAAAPAACFEAVRIGPETARMLQVGEANLALGLVPELETGFYQQTLFAQDWVCLANREHPRIGDGFDPTAYGRESHIRIVSGTGHRLLEGALESQHIRRRVVLELPGFLGLAPIVATTDLIATLPRQIGETLARMNGLKVLPCPVPIPSFTVKLHWHARYHHDAANRWLRGVCASLFQWTAHRPPAPCAP